MEYEWEYRWAQYLCKNYQKHNLKNLKAAKISSHTQIQGDFSDISVEYRIRRSGMPSCAPHLELQGQS